MPLLQVKLSENYTTNDVKRLDLQHVGPPSNEIIPRDTDPLNAVSTSGLSEL